MTTTETTTETTQQLDSANFGTDLPIVDIPTKVTEDVSRLKLKLNSIENERHNFDRLSNTQKEELKESIVKIAIVSLIGDVSTSVSTSYQYMGFYDNMTKAIDLLFELYSGDGVFQFLQQVDHIISDDFKMNVTNKLLSINRTSVTQVDN